MFNFNLSLSLVLFLIGASGVLLRRNTIVIFMCIELMLNAANLSLVTFSSYFRDIGGQVFVLLVMAVAAAEAAVGLAIILAVFKHYRTMAVDAVKELKN